MRGRVYEIGVCGERGGETDCGAVEGGDQDLGVRVEGVGYVQVLGDAGVEGCFARVLFGCI